APTHDAKTRHDWDREINAQDAGNFGSSENAEYGRERMQFHGCAHDPRRNRIVLNQSPDDEKNSDNQPIMVAVKHRYTNDQHRSDQRPYHGNELENAAS